MEQFLIMTRLLTETIQHSTHESTVTVLSVGPMKSNDLRHFLIVHDLR